MAYRQLTREQRYIIYALRQEGCNQRHIARALGVHPATISRELRRNIRRRGYRPSMAHDLAMRRRAVRRKPTKLTPSARNRLVHYLRKRWSPEQISGRLRRLGSLSVGRQTIYTFIERDRIRGGTLYRFLRRGGRRYRHHRTADNRLFRDRISIDQRPAVVDERSRLGDWEADTIISGERGAVLLSLVERCSRLTLLAKLPNKRASLLTQSMIRLLTPLKSKVHTITSDNGTEFACHRIISRRLAAGFYFAHAYKAWERGLNENTNGLVRQYLPKESSFAVISPRQVSAIMVALNHRPRKCLGYQTPVEVFYQP